MGIKAFCLLTWAAMLLCSGPQASLFGADSAPTVGARVLRLATTTSTDDSGLLRDVLPDFEAQNRVLVRVIAVGTGQALKIAAAGDVDVVLVHARQKEDQFVADGHGVARRDVMYNDFVVVGPPADPAGLAGLKVAREAFRRIAATRSVFASRGDESGTHTREKEIWAGAGLAPIPGTGGYLAIGQGMAETLLFANEKDAYALADRGTWLARKSVLPRLTLLVGGGTIAENLDPLLRNPYGVIPVNPGKHPGVQADLALRFAAWITSLEVQGRIADFGKERFGQALFYPDSDSWRAAGRGKSDR